MLLCRSFVAFLLILAGTSAASAATAGYITTGQTGAQTQIDVNHTSKFTITATSPIVLNGGNLTMKAGSATTATATLSLYSDKNKSNLITSVTYTKTQFCTVHGGNCQSYDLTAFDFATPVTIPAGTTYYAELTSSAVDAQSTAYFIKGATDCGFKTKGGQTIAGAQCSPGFIDPPPASPLLAVSKSAPASVNAPGTIDYSLTVTNNGTGASATGATIKDQLPPGVTFASYSGSGWNCPAPVNGLLTCTYGSTIAVAASAPVLTISTTVDDTVSSVENWASVDPTGGSSPVTPSASTCSALDVANGKCASATTDLVIAGPFLDITLSDPTPTPTPGGDSTYTVTVTNHGEGNTSQPVHAYNILPAGTTFVSGGNADWTCSVVPSTNPQVIDCVFKNGTGVIKPDFSFSFPIVVTVDDTVAGGTDLVDQAYVGRQGGTLSTPLPGVCTPNDQSGCAVVTSTVVASFAVVKSSPSPDLKYIGDGTVASSQESTYTLTVSTPAGTSAAEVKDLIPDGLSFVSASGTGFSCSATLPADRVVVCTGSVTAGTDAEISVVVAPLPESINQTVTNYASVGPEGAAPDPGPTCTDADACDSNTETVLTQVGFSVTKSQPVPPLQKGAQSTYTLTVDTDGTDVAAEVRDELPAGLTMVSAVGTGWTCPITPTSSISCTKTISSGQSNTIAITVSVDDTVQAGTVITNYASVGDDGGTNPPPEPGPSCVAVEPCASSAAEVQPDATFVLTKGAPSPALQVGNQSTYRLTVRSDTDGTATDVKDQLPAGLKFVSAVGTGWFCDVDDNNLVLCSKTIDKNVSETIDVTVEVEASAAGTDVENLASAGVSGRAPDPATCDSGAGDACASNTSPVPAVPAISIVKSAPVPALLPGEESTYTLTVTSNTDNVAVDVKDQLPDTLTYVGYTGTGWDCSLTGNNMLLCQKVMDAASEEIEVTVLTDANTAPGASVTNSSSAGLEGEAPDPEGCTEADVCSQNTSSVAAPASFTASKSAPVPQLQIGQQSTYTITVTTDGEDVPAEVKDQLPEGLSYVSASGEGWECGVDGSNLVLCTKSISSGADEKISVTVTTTDQVKGGSVTNYASAGPVGRAPEPGPTCTEDDCAESSGDILPASAFTLQKSAPEPALQVNRQSTYRLTVTTDGEDVATEVKDQLPEGLTFVKATGDGWSCSLEAGNLVVCKKSISSGDSEAIDVTVNVEPQINNQSVTNYASAGADGRAPEPGENCADNLDGGACASSGAARVADIREKIKDAVEDDVKAYLAMRLDQIIGSFDPQSRLQRFRDTACGFSHDLSMSGDATSHDQNLAASGSMSMKGAIVPTADVPAEQCGRFNMWSQLDVNYVNGVEAAYASGGVLTAGAEYLISDNFLAGVRLSLDYADANFDSEANSEISGFGWLAGPYISAEIVNNVFLDGFIGYGTSWNDYSGRYENLDLSGDFTTQRVAGYLNLSGTWEQGQVLLTPMVGVSYGKEWSEGFDVHNDIVGNTAIDSQDAGLGRLTGRVEAGYLVTDEVDERLELFLAPQVTYDLLRDAGPEGDMLLGDGLWRGGLEGGFRFSRERFGASLLLGYDGIGVEDWNAYHGQLQVNYTW